MKKSWIFWFIALLSGCFYIFGTHKALVYVADRYAKEYNLRYESIKGDIFSFVEIKGISYKNQKLVNLIKLNYSIEELFSKEITIKSIKIEHPDIKAILEFAKSFKKEKGSRSDKTINLKIKDVDVSDINYKKDGFKAYSDNISLKDLTFYKNHISLKMDKSTVKLSKDDVSFDFICSGRLSYDIKKKDIRYELDARSGLVSGLKREYRRFVKNAVLKLKGDNKQIFSAFKSEVLDIKYSSKEIFKDAKIYLTSDKINVDANISYVDKNASLYAVLPDKKDVAYKKLFPLVAKVKFFDNIIRSDISNTFFDTDVVFDTKKGVVDIVSKKLAVDMSVKKTGKKIAYGVNISSLSKLYKSLRPIYTLPLEKCHGSLDINGTLKNGIFDFTLKVPWFVKRYSKRKNILLKDVKVDATFEKGVLKIPSYLLRAYVSKKYMSFFQKKGVSYIDLNKNAFSIIVDNELFNSVTKGYIKNDTINMKTSLNSKKSIKDIYVKKATILSLYSMKNGKTSIDINSEIKTKFTDNIKIKSGIKIDKSGKFSYEGDAKIPSFKLPSKEISQILKDGVIKFNGDTKALRAVFENGLFSAKAFWRYKDDKVDAKAHFKDVKLYRFVKNDKLKDVVFSVDLSMPISIGDINKTSVSFTARSNLIDVKGSVDISHRDVNAIVKLPKNSLLYKIDKKFHPKDLFPVNIKLSQVKDSILILAEDKKAKSFISYNLKDRYFKADIEGFSGVRVDIQGKQDEFKYKLKIASLREAKDELKDIYSVSDVEVDSDIFMKGRYVKGRFDADIKSSWFLYRMSFDKYFFIKDISGSLRYKNGVFKLKRYSAKAYVLDNYRKIYSDKASVFKVSDKGIKLSLYLNNDIHIFGKVGKKTNIKVKSKDFHINEPEADVVCGIDLDYSKDANTSSLNGTISLIEGTIRYKPKKSYNINDKDIVFVDSLSQNREKKSNSMKILVNVISKNKILYIDGKNRVYFKNDISFFRYKDDELGVYGYVNILNGTYYSDDKKFEIGEGKLIFDKDYLDPFLDLRAKYKKDPYVITIHIGGRLGSPVISFNSDPYLSQNDILSILIFNSPISSLTGGKNFSANQALTLFGNSFAKGVTNSLGINLDRVQLLTTKEGSFGFVVEKRLSKRVSIVYQNNIVQSIKIKYKNSKHLETDVTYSAESTGVEILYR